MGDVALATRKILEYIIVHLQYTKEEQSKGFSTLEGIFVVLVDIEDSFQHVHHSHCITTISAKGDFCYKLLSDQMCREMKDLLPLCQSKALSGSWCPHEYIDMMPFQLSFELDEKSGAIKEDCLALKQFIHRISLTHTTVKFHYCVKVNGSISAETYKQVCPGGFAVGFYSVYAKNKGCPGLPVLFSTKEACSFLKDPSCLIAWEKYGYLATLNSDPHWEEGDRQVILSHLSSILLCNKQALKGCIQGVVNRILEQHSKASQEQQKLAQSLPIMADAISSIVSSSTNSEFRRKCLQSLQVADTQKFQVTIKDTFNKVVLKQWKCNSSCDTRRPLPKNNEEGVGFLSAGLSFPIIHQKLLDSNFSSAQLEQGGKGLLLMNSDHGEMSRTRSKKLHVEDLEDPHAPEMDKIKENNKRLLVEPGMSSSSFFSHPTKIGCGALQDKSQEMFTDPSMKRIQSNENVWQDDNFWKQEVSNLAKWTP